MTTPRDHGHEPLGSEAEAEAIESLLQRLPEQVRADFQAAQSAAHYSQTPYEFAAAEGEAHSETQFKTLVEIIASRWLAEAGGDLYEYPSKRNLGIDIEERLRLVRIKPEIMSGDDVLLLPRTDFERRRSGVRELFALTHEITLLHEEVQSTNALHLDRPGHLHVPNLDFVRDQLARVWPAHHDSLTHYDVVCRNVIIGTLFINSIGGSVEDTTRNILAALQRASDGRNGFRPGVYNTEYNAGHLILFRENDL